MNDRSHVTDCCVAAGLTRSIGRCPPSVCRDHRPHCPLPSPPARVAATSVRPGGAFITALTGRFWRASENMATMKKLAPVTRPDFERVTQSSARSSYLRDGTTGLASRSHRWLLWIGKITPASFVAFSARSSPQHQTGNYMQICWFFKNSARLFSVFMTTLHMVRYISVLITHHG